MKVFLSWSGDASRIVAEALFAWLPSVIQEVEPFFSPRIEKGIEGLKAISESLESTGFGIICLTPDNLHNNWIHYEVGALSKLPDKRIWTILIGLKPSDVEPPLGQFQHTLPFEDEVLALLISINQHISKPLSDKRLQMAFSQWWPSLRESFERASAALESLPAKKQDIRSERNILNEILDTLRSQPWNETDSKWTPASEIPVQNEFIFVCTNSASIPAVNEVIKQAKEAGIVKNSLITPLAGGTFSIRVILLDIDKYSDFLPYYNSLSELGVTTRRKLSAT